MADRRSDFWEDFKRSLVFWPLWLLVTGIAATVRFRVEGWDKLLKVVRDGKGGLVLPWHGVTILPIFYCRNMGFYSMVSVSRDGKLQDKMLRSRGFNTIRGSSGRHGVRALLEAVRLVHEGAVLAHTPDGPKGPPKKVQPGTVYLAQKSGCPILPVGVACSPCKRLRSWDSHMVPLPFARAAIAFGDPIYIGADEDENEGAIRIENAINEADLCASEILEGGRKPA